MAEAVGLPDGLARYLAARDKQRQDRAVEKWEALTPREQDLVREAAVLSFVNGQRYGDANPPSDSAILHRLLGAADAFADLYPMLAALPRRRRAAKRTRRG